MGEDNIEVDQGYWRYTTNSTTVIECPNINACNGGFHPDNKYPTQWAPGYEGILWSDCQILNNVKYQPLSGFRCVKCPSPLFNTIRVVVVIAIAFLFLILLIYMNLRKRKDSQQSILLRILTNYIQLISASMAFNVRIPSSFDSMFSQVDRVSSPNETFFSFDCFIKDYEIRMFAPSNALFKLFLYMFLPLILIGIISIGLFCLKGILYALNPAKTFDLNRSIVVSMVGIVFLFHPTLTLESLSVFLCNKIDADEYRMTYHMEYKCYSRNHLIWSALVGLPIIIVWVFGTPIITLIYLTKHRKQLEDWSIKKYFMIIYQGLRSEMYYWEFVNILRKFLILAINVFAYSTSINVKLALSISKWISIILIFLIFISFSYPRLPHKASNIFKSI